MKQHEYIEPLQGDEQGRIVAHAEHGQHIDLTCVNHTTLLWSTKNILYIGARTIFFNLNNDREMMGKECDCPLHCLKPVKPE